MLVIAAIGRKRVLLTSSTAVVLMWFVLGGLFGWLLWR
jgi:hypothetical protein